MRNNFSLELWQQKETPEHNNHQHHNQHYHTKTPTYFSCYRVVRRFSMQFVFETILIALVGGCAYYVLYIYKKEIDGRNEDGSSSGSGHILLKAKESKKNTAQFYL